MPETISLLVPENLDMTLFGEDADRIAYILDRLYQGNGQGNYNEEAEGDYDDDDPVTISTDHLKYVFSEPNPQELMDQISHPIRGDRRSIDHRIPRLVEEVIRTDGKYVPGKKVTKL